MTPGAAVYAGPGALRLLREGERGHVTVVVGAGAAAYAQLDGGHFQVTRVGAPFGPLSVAVTRVRDLELLPGVEVAVLRGALAIGADRVSLARVRVRRPAAVAAGPVDADPAIVAAIRARLAPPGAFLEPGVRTLQRGRLRKAVTMLAGRGAGLTPDGDDILAGYAAWRHAMGDPVVLSEVAAQLASPIGLSYLRCAEQGELPDAAAGLLAALRAGNRETALACLPELLRWGGSSGSALAHGILAGACASGPERSSLTP